MNLREGLRRLGLAITAVYGAGALLACGAFAWGDRYAPQKEFTERVGAQSYQTFAYSQDEAKRAILAFAAEHAADCRGWGCSDAIYVPADTTLRVDYTRVAPAFARNVLVAILLFLPFAGIGWLFGWIVDGFAGGRATAK